MQLGRVTSRRLQTVVDMTDQRHPPLVEKVWPGLQMIFGKMKLGRFSLGLTFTKNENQYLSQEETKEKKTS